MGPASTLTAQRRPDPAALMAAQQEAMNRLAFMDGVWKGSAWTVLPNGEKHTMTQTERVGAFLDGTVKVIEGRGYGEDGSSLFNALGIVSYDPNTQTYSLHSYAQGRSGDFVVTPTADGMQWEIPAGSMTIRYTAVIRDGAWNEAGDRVMPDGSEIRFFEMNLTRVGNTDWPSAGAVEPE
jgi:hypothetical protein